MPLKNFSSGMQLRLAFAVVVQTEPDILLVDEIYAVGDAGFQQKCTEALLQLRDRGKTVVVVTHDMEVVQRFCDRALLIEKGRIDAEGDPEEVVRRYFELTLAHRPAEVSGFLIEHIGGFEAESRARITELKIIGSGERATIEPGVPIEVEAAIEVERPIRAAGLRLEVRTEHGARIFSPEDASAAPEDLEYMPGQRVRATVTIENRLSPGEYRLSCIVLHNSGEQTIGVSPTSSVAFGVEGTAHPGVGLVSLDHQVRFEAASSSELSPT